MATLDPPFESPRSVRFRTCLAKQTDPFISEALKRGFFLASEFDKPVAMMWDFTQKKWVYNFTKLPAANYDHIVTIEGEILSR